MLRLAVPVVLAELGWMGMGVVDTIMVGPLGPEAIGAAGVSNSLHMALAIFGMGLLLGLDTLVSQAFGARRADECHRWLLHGIALALVMSPALVGACFVLLLIVPRFGFHPTILPLVQEYFTVLLWSSVPLLFYAVFRRYLQAINAVQPVMFALVSANVVNALGNWVFIYGHLGADAMGVRGSALATLIARAYMAVVLLAAVILYDNRKQRARVREAQARASLDRLAARREVLAASPAEHVGLWKTSWRIDPARLRTLVSLGLPAAITITLEVGMFAAATALAGTLNPVATAAHQIALNVASVSFMIPLGLASAGAVRVGQAVGAENAAGAAAAGWAAILLGVLFMSGAALLFIALPRGLIGLFTKDPAVMALGASLLVVASIFQLFDGVQGVATGVLRGLGDTRTAMVTNLGGYWLLGLPVGYALCFNRGYGAIGLWIGLSIGLTVVASVLLWVWWARIDQFVASGQLPTTRTRRAARASALSHEA